MTQDQELLCRDCKKGFTFTAGEQAFFKERNFGPPVRCKACRDSRKAASPPIHAKPAQPVVQRVAERSQFPRERESRGLRWENDQPAKFDRHASKRQKWRHDTDDDDYDEW